MLTAKRITADRANPLLFENHPIHANNVAIPEQITDGVANVIAIDAPADEVSTFAIYETT